MSCRKWVRPHSVTFPKVRCWFCWPVSHLNQQISSYKWSCLLSKCCLEVEKVEKFLSSQFRAVKGIRRFHHFRVTADDSWTVYLKERIDGVEKLMSIRKRGATPFDATELPEEITPPPLALHLSGSNICTGMSVHTLDLHTRMNCVQRHQRSRQSIDCCKVT